MRGVGTSISSRLNLNRMHVCNLVLMKHGNRNDCVVRSLVMMRKQNLISTVVLWFRSGMPTVQWTWMAWFRWPCTAGPSCVVRVALPAPTCGIAPELPAAPLASPPVFAWATWEWGEDGKKLKPWHLGLHHRRPRCVAATDDKSELTAWRRGHIPHGYVIGSYCPARVSSAPSAVALCAAAPPSSEATSWRIPVGQRSLPEVGIQQYMHL